MLLTFGNLYLFESLYLESKNYLNGQSKKQVDVVTPRIESG